LRNAQRLLRDLLLKRFGTLPDELLQRIERITEVDRLRAAALEVYSVATPDELQL